MHDSKSLFAWPVPLRLRATRKISQVNYQHLHLTWHEKQRQQITHLQGQQTASGYFQYGIAKQGVTMKRLFRLLIILLVI
ncbi:hypothetical protein, partial [Serratia sp. CY39337]|uniref:hypothetical protein n=1 Tax=Serratia sp. CY39337 TaxID=3383614 RepID=UPI003F9FD897